MLLPPAGGLFGATAAQQSSASMHRHSDTANPRVLVAPDRHHSYTVPADDAGHMPLANLPQQIDMANRAAIAMLDFSSSSPGAAKVIDPFPESDNAEPGILPSSLANNLPPEERGALPPPESGFFKFMRNVGDSLTSSLADSFYQWVNKATDETLTQPKTKYVRKLIIYSWEKNGLPGLLLFSPS
jgi:hypothetical protein